MANGKFNINSLDYHDLAGFLHRGRGSSQAPSYYKCGVGYGTPDQIRRIGHNRYLASRMAQWPFEEQPIETFDFVLHSTAVMSVGFKPGRGYPSYVSFTATPWANSHITNGFRRALLCLIRYPLVEVSGVFMSRRPPSYNQMPMPDEVMADTCTETFTLDMDYNVYHVGGSFYPVQMDYERIDRIETAMRDAIMEHHSWALLLPCDKQSYRITRDVRNFIARENPTPENIVERVKRVGKTTQLLRSLVHWAVNEEELPFAPVCTGEIDAHRVQNRH